MHNNIYDNDSNVSIIQLHEEQLDISKNLIQTGDFTIYKETYIEEKTLTVPVTHVDLVIIPKNLEDNNDKIKPIRIPLTEEKFEINKYPIQLEDVTIYKNKFETIMPIETTLRKEFINVSNIGDVPIINNL